MARYDKYEPKSGGFRAPLAADLTATSETGVGNPIGVGLDASGRVVVGVGNTGILGVICTTRNMTAGEIVDVMTDGEIVEMAAPAVAGTVLHVVDASGAIGAGAPAAGQTRVGHTVEATRLVVRVAR